MPGLLYPFITLTLGPSSDAWLPSVSLSLHGSTDPPVGWPGRYIILRHYGGLFIVPLQLKDPLELFVKRREFLPGSWFLSCRDMT